MSRQNRHNSMGGDADGARSVDLQRSASVKRPVVHPSAWNARSSWNAGPLTPNPGPIVRAACTMWREAERPRAEEPMSSNEGA
jgi:hypothetical protein